MKTFIALVSWTQKGIQEFRESPSRVDKAKAMISAAGGEMTSFHMTLGHYDMVAVIEAPDEQTYTKIMHLRGSKVGVRTETLRAFPEYEYRSIIESAT